MVHDPTERSGKLIHHLSPNEKERLAEIEHLFGLHRDHEKFLFSQHKPVDGRDHCLIVLDALHPSTHVFVFDIDAGDAVLKSPEAVALRTLIQMEDKAPLSDGDFSSPPPLLILSVCFGVGRAMPRHLARRADSGGVPGYS
jgi:hypothetical protein